MTLRSMDLQVVQLGAETTPGTAVPATNRLPNLDLQVLSKGNANPIFYGSGMLYGSDVANTVEWGGGPWKIPATYDELAWVFDSHFGIATPSTLASGAYQRVWNAAIASAATRRFYSSQRGQAGAAELFTMGCFNTLKYAVQKLGAQPEFSGDYMCQESLPATALTQGVISASVTAAGTGYTSATAATSGGGQITPATFTVTVTGGVVTAVTPTAAGVYTGTPTIVISGDGSGATATPTMGVPNTVTSSIIPATAFDFYYATTMAGLDGSPTHLTTGWKLDYSHGPVLGEGYFVNSSEPSYDAMGIIRPANAISLTLAKDVSGSDFTDILTFAKKRAGTLVYIQVKALGAQIGVTGFYRTFKHNMAIRVLNVPNEVALDSAKFAGNDWPCELVVDPVSQKAQELPLINTTATVT